MLCTPEEASGGDRQHRWTDARLSEAEGIGAETDCDAAIGVQGPVSREKAVKDRRGTSEQRKEGSARDHRGLSEGPSRALRGTVEAGTVDAWTAAGTMETGEGSQRPEHKDDLGEASKQEEISVRQRRANRDGNFFLPFKPGHEQEVVTQGHDFCLLPHPMLTWH
ncbi:hypothetical protein Syun_001883 [Stephania yunnanensis]|uniref:Uncharacterized protein n=1 Tax=Stephania yunnanensis TaxID=152371 RepID=A0AAP0LFP7_9MAGN